MNLNRHDIPDGLITVDSEWGCRLGFTSDKFLKDGQLAGELYKRGDDIYIQSIGVLPARRRQNCLNNLMNALWDLGFKIKVPNPLPLMLQILKKKGFEEADSELTLVPSETHWEEIWAKSPPAPCPPRSSTA